MKHKEERGAPHRAGTAGREAGRRRRGRGVLLVASAGWRGPEGEEERPGGREEGPAEAPEREAPRGRGRRRGAQAAGPGLPAQDAGGPRGRRRGWRREDGAAGTAGGPLGALSPAESSTRSRRVMASCPCNRPRWFSALTHPNVTDHHRVGHENGDFIIFQKKHTFNIKCQ